MYKRSMNLAKETIKQSFNTIIKFGLFSIHKSIRPFCQCHVHLSSFIVIIKQDNDKQILKEESMLKIQCLK